MAWKKWLVGLSLHHFRFWTRRLSVHLGIRVLTRPADVIGHYLRQHEAESIVGVQDDEWLDPFDLETYQG
jgi:hypothetical protein